MRTTAGEQPRGWAAVSCLQLQLFHCHYPANGAAISCPPPPVGWLLQYSARPEQTYVLMSAPQPHMPCSSCCMLVIHCPSAPLSVYPDPGCCVVGTQVTGVEIPTPLPRLTYRESLERFGNDKPDMRYALELSDVTSAVHDSTFRWGFVSTQQKIGSSKTLVAASGHHQMAWAW